VVGGILAENGLTSLDDIGVLESFNGDAGFFVTNNSSGTLATSIFNAVNSSGQRTFIGSTSSGYTGLPAMSVTGLIFSNATQGLALMASAASSNIRFMPGGTAEIARFTTNGLGIGTSPATTGIHLDVIGTIRGTGGAGAGGAGYGIRLVDSTGFSGGSITVPEGSSTGLVVSGDGGPLSFFAGGSQRMLISAAGAFGLNCSPSASTIRVQAPGFNDAGLEWSRFSASAGYIQSINRASSIYTSLYTDAADYQWNISTTPKAYLTGTGLGINASPQAAFEVVANGASMIVRNPFASSYGGIRIYNDLNTASRAVEIDYAGSTFTGPLVGNGPTGEQFAISVIGGFPITFATNNIARLQITPTGNLGINTNDIHGRINMRKDTTATDDQNFIHIQNNGNGGDNSTYVVGGIMWSAYRDVANPSIISAIWTQRDPQVGGLASAGSLVFGCAQTGGSSISTPPTERMRIPYGNFAPTISDSSGTRYPIAIDPGAVVANIPIGAIVFGQATLPGGSAALTGLGTFACGASNPIAWGGYTGGSSTSITFGTWRNIGASTAGGVGLWMRVG
jgi:hypothetical protein